MAERSAMSPVRALLALALLLPLMAAARAHAEDAPQLRVVVRVSCDEDRAIVPRVRGQLSDVHSELIVVETRALESTFGAQVERARALAEQQQAQVVLWFAKWAKAKHPKEILVHVATPREDRVFTRRLHADDAQGSALLESAALVVRGAVSALAAGGTIGVETKLAVAGGEDIAAASADTPETTAAPATPTLAASTEPPASTETQPTTTTSAQSSTSTAASASPSSPATPETETESVPDTREAEPQVATRASWRGTFFVGMHSVLDGASSYGQHGVLTRLGVGYGALELAAFGGIGLAATIDDPWLKLQVARHDAGGVLAMSALLGTQWRLALGAAAGAALLSRTSVPKSAAAHTNAGQLTAAFFAGPDVLLAWHPNAFGLALDLGLDVFPNAPSFRLRTSNLPGSKPIVHALDTIEPRASLGVEVRVP